MGLPTKDSAAPETEAPTATPLYTGSGSSPNLPPLPYPLGVVSEYTQHRTTIALRIRQLKSSFHGREFAVKDAVTSNALFDVRGKTSFFQRKVLYDRTGKPLLEFHRYPFSVPKSYIGPEPDNKHKQLFVVQRKGLFRQKLVIKFPNLVTNGEQEKWTLKGEWFSGTCQLTTEAGVVVAVTTRDYVNAGQIF